MYNSIINPNTGRKCSINSKLGRKILQRYINEVQEGGSAQKKYEKKKSSAVYEPCKRVQEAMKKMGVVNSQGQAALNLLKDIVGKNMTTVHGQVHATLNSKKNYF